MATTESYKNKNGEKVNDTTWHNIEKVGKNLENFAKYIKKGTALEVVGKQEHRKVDDKYFSSVKAEMISFCPAKKSEASQPANEQSKEADDLPF